jgi:hypothetical protein
MSVLSALPVSARRKRKNGRMKKILELLVCFIHPLAMVLAWINIAGRSDLSGGQKVIWAILVIIPIVPFIYVLTGGDLW